MATPPPIPEIEFMALAKNFAELRERLRALGFSTELSLLTEYAHHVAACWFRLGEEHLAEAVAAATASLARTAYSRSYYAAYNTSKAVRYMTRGAVSLKGDDHKAAPDLPDDFPDAAIWATTITTLYEHRLRADYDNWLGTSAAHTVAFSDAVVSATGFVAEARQYLSSKFGMAL